LESQIIESNFHHSSGTPAIAAGAGASGVSKTTSRYYGTLTTWQRRRVVQFIEENLANVIRIEDLADLARLSCGYFTTTFKSDFGQSPYQYVISRRLEVAKKLLRETQRSLCEIAMDCGLSDQAHLCNLFRRHCATTPNKWRKRSSTFSSSQVGTSENALEPYASSV